MHSVEIGSKVSAGTIFTSRLVWIDSKLATYHSYDVEELS